MTNIVKLGVLCVALGLAGGCTGAKISLDHHSEGYGQAPPIPKAGGSGPPELGRVIELPADDFTIPTGLPDLLDVYRERLVAMGHVFSASLAEQYADTEIASLKRRYGADSAALRAELIRRLQPKIARPGSPNDLKQKTATYPIDPDDKQVEPGRVQ
jgi:hypothetical protein